MNNYIRIGFSPCPNDTFIFDALVHQKIDTKGFTFEPVLADVEKLNTWALEKKLAVTKISYAVLPLVSDHYKLLNSGSALGAGVGPLLIKKVEDNIHSIEDKLIAIPGEHTTAHLLFSLAYPLAKNKIFLRYDAIEEFVLQGRGLGVIIHENRFTYEGKGLEKIKDLGEYWEKETGNHIPLGGIVIDRNLNHTMQQNIDGLVRKSIEYAFVNYPELSDFVKEHAQEMSEDVMRKHINLYVNNFSLDLGMDGRAAIKKLMQVYNSMHDNNFNSADLFV